MTSLTVARTAGHVVLTMPPHRARLVADSIELGDADHTAWLDSLADLLRSAADRGDQPFDSATAIGTTDTTSEELLWPAPAALAEPAGRSDMAAAPTFAEALALASEAELFAAMALEL